MNWLASYIGVLGEQSVDGSAVRPWMVVLGVVFVVALLALWAIGVRYIPNNRVGVVEKLWSGKGSVPAGGILALRGEAGYQVALLRGGIHFGLWRWQYKIHKIPLVTIPQGKIGYVYARDGEPLSASQTLGRDIDCNNFQDAALFLAGANGVRGQRGRQRAILREGVYAINQALFIVITEDVVYQLEVQGRRETERLGDWQKELAEVDGFDPVVVGGVMEAPDPLNPDHTIMVDSIAIVTVQDGPSLTPGEIIAPSVGNDPDDGNFHNNFQDPDAFLRAGGRRGRQYVPLTDGTYFINRWFAGVQHMPKTIVPIGYVGVVVSYYGPIGTDVSGDSFRHGERVARGERGVWEKPFGPGKYPFNTYAGQIVFVPTTNFVLHWISGKVEGHRYDEGLNSIELVTKDAYESALPLSVVVHIDYQRASAVIQRFGDVKRLITQTLDPMLSSFFRDVAHRKTMLELLHDRDTIQAEARAELQRRFAEFDIQCVDVLIGKPDTVEAGVAGGGKIEQLLEQLRTRQLSIEQMETYDHQRTAAERQRALKEAEAIAAKQPELTASHVAIQIAENAANAELAKARRQAEQAIVKADAELETSRRQAERTVVTAKAEAESRQLAGRGEASRTMQVGLSEAAVQMRKIASFGDPRLFALSLVAEHLSKSAQPLVPERVFTTGGDGKDGGSSGLLNTLLAMLVAEKSGFKLAPSDDDGQMTDLKAMVDAASREMVESVQGQATPATEPTPANNGKGRIA
jgi:uncharacterized membrane protein YqiK